MVDTVATLKFNTKQVGDLRELSLAQLYAMLLEAENIAVLVQRDRLLAVLDEALKHDREELLERGLDRALDRQALSVHHLEAALHDERDELARRLDRVRVEEREQQLENADLGHLV